MCKICGFEEAHSALIDAWGKGGFQHKYICFSLNLWCKVPHLFHSGQVGSELQGLLCGHLAEEGGFPLGVLVLYILPLAPGSG